MCVCVLVYVHVWSLEDNLWMSLFSFCHMGSRDWTGARQQAPVPLSHLADPIESSLTNTTVLVIFLIAVTQYLQEQLEGRWVYFDT